MVAFVSLTVIGPPTVRKSDYNKMARETMRTLGNQWHKRFRAPHFTLGAYTRYGYLRRKPTYDRIKKKAVGHVKPLVLSGTSEALSRVKTVRATKNSSTVRMPIRQFNRVSRHSKIDKVKEFQTVAITEKRRLEKHSGVQIEQKLNRYKRRKKMV